MLLHDALATASLALCRLLVVISEPGDVAGRATEGPRGWWGGGAGGWAQPAEVRGEA